MWLQLLQQSNIVLLMAEFARRSLSHLLFRGKMIILRSGMEGAPRRCQKKRKRTRVKAWSFSREKNGAIYTGLLASFFLFSLSQKKVQRWKRCFGALLKIPDLVPCLHSSQVSGRLWLCLGKQLHQGQGPSSPYPLLVIEERYNSSRPKFLEFERKTTQCFTCPW